MLSLIRNWLYNREVKQAPRLPESVGAEIANCPKCVGFLHNRYALSFIAHAVETHHIDHDTAVMILDRLHQERMKR